MLIEEIENKNPRKNKHMTIREEFIWNTSVLKRNKPDNLVTEQDSKEYQLI